MHRAVLKSVGLVALTLCAAPAAAQSDILLQLRSGSPAGDRFRVGSAGMETRNAEIAARNAELEARIARLEALVGQPAP